MTPNAFWPLAVLAALLLEPFSSWGQIVLIVLVAVLIVFVAVNIALMLTGLRRQRTIDDDREAMVRRAHAKEGAEALWTYHRAPDGQIRYLWDHVDAGFPLPWSTGDFVDKPISETVPNGAPGDEARAAYRGCLDYGRTSTYIRTEPHPATGQGVTIRYRHVRLANGNGSCQAVPLSPEIDAARDERDRLRTEAARLTADNKLLRDQLRTIREQEDARDRLASLASTRA